MKMAKISYAKCFLTQILIIVGIIVCTEARRYSPLLVEEEGSKRNRPAECQFGKTIKELGSSWFADLGPPFGVMYCIKCECLPVQKKRRIVARVQCRNIKNECPKPTCEEPILLPGRCCKTCPGDLYSPDVVQDIPQSMPVEEEERNMKHFAALLTERTSYMLKREEMKSQYSTNNPQNIVATGRFSFHRKNLYYSFYISEKSKRPRAIQFVDDSNGNILEEHSFTDSLNGPYSVYQNATGKICGVWRRVPREYRKLLRDDLMNVVLLWGGDFQAELALAGPIGKYPALSTESFSSLLEPAAGTSPDQMSGAGGTAIVSTSSGVTSSIHITLVLNGLFAPDEISDVPLNIRLESVEKKQIILEDVQRVRKPNHDINVIEVSSPVTVYDLRMLARGRLTLTVESRKRPDALRIQGNVVTRVACEIFQTLLSTHNPESQAKTSGLAWMYLNKEGSLVYNIQTNNLNLQDHPLLTLMDDSAKRKTELEDLTPSLVIDHAVGTLDRLGPKVLEPLYSGDLAINVATEREPVTLIRGRLVTRPVADSRDSTAPVLLKRMDITAPSNFVGMAWVAVDNECNLHYEVTLTGVPHHYQPLQLFLEEIPIDAPGAPVSRRLLEEFSGNYMEGFVLGMSPTDLAKLETSVCYLEVRRKDRDEAVLKATLKSTKIPSHCFPQYTDNDVPKSPLTSEPNDNNLPTVDTKCYHSGRFYDEGESWRSNLENCTICSCMFARVKCEPIKCPPLKCNKDEIKHRKGECCPSCMSDNKPFIEPNTTLTTRGCQLGDEFHLAGASWHPYLPPNGFDTCTVCACDLITLEIKCPRTVCPPLHCSDKVAYRPDKKACCKVCPEIKLVVQNPMSPNEQKDEGAVNGTIASKEEIMKNGGCKSPMGIHENGMEWHPIIASHGEQKCIRCRCKDGNIACDRKRCARSVCNNRLISAKKKGFATQSQNADDDCCQCNRGRQRHPNHKKRQQKQKEQQEKDKSYVKS